MFSSCKYAISTEMRCTQGTVIATVLCIVLACPGVAYSDVYQCKKDGQLVFSDQPCDGAVIQRSQQKAPPRPPAKVREVSRIVVPGSAPSSGHKQPSQEEIRHSIQQHELRQRLKRAIYHGKVDLLPELLPMLDDINVIHSDFHGAPLHLGAKAVWNAGEVVRILIEHGADVNIRIPSRGTTPLIHAARFNKLEACRVLIEHGADINAADSKGLTPLAWAMNLKNYDIEGFLKENGATE